MAFVTALTLTPSRLRSFPSHTSLANRPRFSTRLFKMLTTGFGISTSPHLPTAISEALDRASIPSPTLAMVTCTVDRDIPQLLSTLQSRLPQTSIHGATTCNAVLTPQGSHPNAIAILLFSSPNPSFAVACGKGSGIEAGRNAALQLKEKLPDVKYVIMQATPGIEEDVIKGVQEELGKVAIFGGSAADNTVEGGWRLFGDYGVFDQGVSLVGIAGDVKFASRLIAPYNATSNKARVTKVEGRRVIELNGRKAAQVLREWIGESVDQQCREGGSVVVECASKALGVKKGDGWVGIHVAEVDKEGGIGLFAEVAEGEEVVVMEGWGKDCAESARLGLAKGVEEVKEEVGEVEAGVMIYCGGLSIAVGDGLDGSLKGAGGVERVLGMTAFGEQGNVGGSGAHSNLAVGIGVFGKS